MLNLAFTKYKMFPICHYRYIDHNHKHVIAEDFLPRQVVDQLKYGSNSDTANSTSEPPHKRPKLKGRHKKRPIEKNPENKNKICPQILAERQCSFGERCKFSHDVAGYIDSKPSDLGETCYLFDINGYCQYSYACRYASKHLTDDHKNIINEELYEKMKGKKSILNVLDKDIQRKLWKKKYDFSLADKIWKGMKKAQEGIKRPPSAGLSKTTSESNCTKCEDSSGKQTTEAVANRSQNGSDSEQLGAKSPTQNVSSLNNPTCDISGVANDTKTLVNNSTGEDSINVPCATEVITVMKTGTDIVKDVGRDTDKKVVIKFHHQ
jgi:hypothetical protein